MAVSLSNYEKYLKYRRPTDFQFQKDYQKYVWAFIKQDVYEFGQVSSEGDKMMKVILNKDGKEKSFAKEKCFRMNPPKFDGVEDCSNLPQLHEPAVLYNIKIRYDTDIFHTYSGLFLVVLNPYKWIPVYTDNMIELYIGKRRDEMAPHVFAMADTAYRAMLEQRKNQSMLITGESGAGKTENTKKVIQYLAHIAGRGGTKGELERKLLQANPLLEAVANAKTTKNNNSSRFGKFIKITFDKSGYISGASIVVYLLEKSRIVHQGKNERCFHIFYQMMAGLSAEDKAKYHLTVPDDYGFLNHSGCTSVRYMDDKKEFATTLEALDTLKFSDDEKAIIFKICAAICHLGNLKLKPESKNSDNAVIDSKDVIEKTAELLEIDVTKFERGLINPRIKVAGGREMVAKHLNCADGYSSRDALVKALYGRMFLWIVDKINQTLTVEANDLFIGILDIAGFEIFEVNSFEQLCINFTNEKLQQFFNHHMFTLEQEEYQREKIQWTWVNFGIDSQATIDLLEKKPNGIFPLLDEQSVFPAATDATFVDKVDKAHKGRHPKYYKNELGKKNNFCLRHYAGEVEYDTDKWLEKNRDPLQTDLQAAVIGSKSRLIKYFFSEFDLNKPGGSAGKQKKGSRRGANFITVGGAYKDQLNDLMSTLRGTYPHFIRCILPNRKQVSGELENDIVLLQLRCNGVLEGIRIQRQGFPNRMLYKTFLKRYYIIAPGIPRRAADVKGATKGIIDYLVEKGGDNVINPEKLQYGITKIFFRVGELAKIEAEREKKISGMIVTLQAACRGYVYRRLYKKTQERAIASKIIQRNIRAWLEFKNWTWFKLYVKARPLITIQNHAADKENLQKQIDELTKKMEAAVAIKDSLEAEIQSLKTKNQETEDELNSERARADDFESKVASLENDKKRIESEIDNLNADLDAEREALADLKKRNLTLQGDLDDAKDDLEAAETAKDDLMRVKKKLQEDIEDLNNKLDEETDAKERLEKSKKELEQEVKDLDADLAEMTSSKAKSDTLSKQLNIQLDEANEDLEKEKRARQKLDKDRKQLELDLDAANDSLTAAEKKASDLGKKLKKTEDDLIETQNKLEDANDELEGLQGRANVSDTELNALKEDAAALEAKFNKLKREKADLEDKLDDAESDLDVEKRKSAGLQKDLENAKAELAELTDSLEDEKRKGAQAERANNKNEAKIKELTRKLAEAEAARDDFEQKSRKLTEQVAELGLELESEKKLRGDIEKVRKDLDVQIIELQGKLEAANTANTALEKDKKTLQGDKDKLEDDIDDLKSAAEDLEKEKNKLITETDDLKSRIEQSDAEKTKLKEDALRLKGELEASQSELESAESKFAALQKQNKDLLLEMDELRDAITDGARDLERANKQKEECEKSLKDIKDTLDMSSDLLSGTADALQKTNAEMDKLKETNDDLVRKLQNKAKELKLKNAAV